MELEPISKAGRSPPQNSTLNSRTLTSLRLQHQVRKLRKRPDKIRPF